MRHPGVWQHAGVSWAAARAMPSIVSACWPASETPPGRSTVYDLVARGIVATVRDPSGCRSWWGYGGEPVTAVPSLMAAVVAYRASVTTSKVAQAAIARTARAALNRE